jgi:capsular polysaccharide biosynthesis protein
MHDKGGSVEIIDFLHVARRRIAVLVAVPLLAAAAAAALVLLAPVSYTATTTVWAPALVGGAAGNQYTGSQAVSQFASAFQATATSPAVRQTVSDRTGVDRNEIASNLTVAQVGASSSMTLTYTDTTDKYVAPVLSELTKETLRTMFGSQVSLAETQVTAAKADVQAANAAIAAWEQKANMVDPQQVYQARIDQINSLLQQQSTLRANGSTTAAAAVGASITSLRSTLSAFSTRLAEYTTLTAARDAATASLTSSQQGLLAARTQLSAADPSQVSFTGKVHEVSETPALLTKVLPVVGAGIFLAVVLVAMLELLARSRAVRSSRGAAGAIDGDRRAPATDYAPVPPPVDRDGDDDRDGEVDGDGLSQPGRHAGSDLVTSRE